MCLVWSQLADIKTPPIVTSDFVYGRLIGDRSIQEKDFGRIQIDRIKEMKKVARNFKKVSMDTIKQRKIQLDAIKCAVFQKILQELVLEICTLIRSAANSIVNY
jgi:hypothetical protein